MPEATTETVQPAETPAEKTMRRYYEGRLAERLMQAASLAENRRMLRRGARKQQDGTLGQPGEPSDLEDDVQIHIGDIHQVTSQPAATTALVASVPLEATDGGLGGTLKKAAVAAALVAGGTGAGMIASHLLADDPTPAVAEAGPDADTQYILKFSD